MLDWKAINKEAVGHFQDLLRVDTTNPPGEERAAAELIAEALRRDGIEPTILESSPKRANLVARLKGTGELPPLLLTAHLDVVPAEEGHWTHPPFAGVIENGVIYGRGAIDMKNMAAMSLMTMLVLKRSAARLRRDVIFVACADEEMGSGLGSLWLVDNHPDLVRAEYGLNECGGFTSHFSGVRFYPVQVAEKGFCWTTLRCTGDPGHGSMPHGNNAVVKLARAVERLGEVQFPMHPVAEVEAFIRGMAEHLGFPTSAALRLMLDPRFNRFVVERLIPEDLRGAFRANFRNTVSPTVLRAGSKTNVIPSSAEAKVDGRVLPGQDRESFLAEMREIVGPDVEFHVDNYGPPTVFSAETPLMEKIFEVLRRHDTAAVPVPFMISGFTDAKAYAKLGTIVYGFNPIMMPKDLSFTKLFHGHDERCTVEGFEFGLRCLY
ncbi:MAG: M20/M25/M40 family metallo-hydrolase, partial [Candidatus Methylomirabilis sp.]|nr:M20/M25/M40 family metallo-hydrolase [Deltaproteobacteria bacterium]